MENNKEEKRPKLVLKLGSLEESKNHYNEYSEKNNLLVPDPKLDEIWKDYDTSNNTSSKL